MTSFSMMRMALSRWPRRITSFMSMLSVCWPRSVVRMTRVRPGAALSVKPPAIVMPSSTLVSLSSWYAPGFLTSPNTKNVLPLGTSTVSPSSRRKLLSRGTAPARSSEIVSCRPSAVRRSTLTPAGAAVFAKPPASVMASSTDVSLSSGKVPALPTSPSTKIADALGTNIMSPFSRRMFSLVSPAWILRRSNRRMLLPAPGVARTTRTSLPALFDRPPAFASTSSRVVGTDRVLLGGGGAHGRARDDHEQDDGEQADRTTHAHARTLAVGTTRTAGLPPQLKREGDLGPDDIVLEIEVVEIRVSPGVRVVRADPEPALDLVIEADAQAGELIIAPRPDAVELGPLVRVLVDATEEPDGAGELRREALLEAQRHHIGQVP